MGSKQLKKIVFNFDNKITANNTEIGWATHTFTHGVEAVILYSKWNDTFRILYENIIVLDNENK